MRLTNWTIISVGTDTLSYREDFSQLSQVLKLIKYFLIKSVSPVRSTLIRRVILVSTNLFNYRFTFWKEEPYFHEYSTFKYSEESRTRQRWSSNLEKKKVKYIMALWIFEKGHLGCHIFEFFNLRTKTYIIYLISLLLSWNNFQLINSSRRLWWSNYGISERDCSYSIIVKGSNNQKDNTKWMDLKTIMLSKRSQK